MPTVSWAGQLSLLGFDMQGKLQCGSQRPLYIKPTCFETFKAVLTLNFLSSPANMFKGNTLFSAFSTLTYHLTSCQMLTQVQKYEYKFDIIKLEQFFSLMFCLRFSSCSWILKTGLASLKAGLSPSKTQCNKRHCFFPTTYTLLMSNSKELYLKC